MKVLDTIQTVYSVGSLDFVILKESLIFVCLRITWGMVPDVYRWVPPLICWCVEPAGGVRLVRSVNPSCGHVAFCWLFLPHSKPSSHHSATSFHPQVPSANRGTVEPDLSRHLERRAIVLDWVRMGLYELIQDPVTWEWWIRMSES